MVSLKEIAFLKDLLEFKRWLLTDSAFLLFWDSSFNTLIAVSTLQLDIHVQWVLLSLCERWRVLQFSVPKFEYIHEYSLEVLSRAIGYLLHYVCSWIFNSGYHELFHWVVCQEGVYKIDHWYKQLIHEAGKLITHVLQVLKGAFPKCILGRGSLSTYPDLWTHSHTYQESGFYTQCFVHRGPCDHWHFFWMKGFLTKHMWEIAVSSYLFEDQLPCHKCDTACIALKCSAYVCHSFLTIFFFCHTCKMFQ